MFEVFRDAFSWALEDKFEFGLRLVMAFEEICQLETGVLF
jgi:hypothetical protein